MLICDTHADTLWGQVPHEGRKPENQMDITLEMMTARPQQTHLQVLALYVETGGMQKKPTIVEQELSVWEHFLKIGFRQVRHVEEVLPGKANVMLSIEGGEAFEGDTENVRRFAELGVRMTALMWNNENGIGHSAVSGFKEGLTPFGKRLTRALRQERIAVDISHLNIRGSEEVMDSDIPVLASHSCAYALCPHPRNLSDEQLRTLFHNKGFVGINFFAKFLKEDGEADLNTVVDHMVHMCNLGGEDNIGLGSDFDGITLYPKGLRNTGDIPKLIETMVRRGFSQELCEKIAGLNFKRYMNLIDHSIV